MFTPPPRRGASLIRLLFAAATWCVALAASAQPAAFRAPPRLGFAYPAGAQQGTTATVALGGQYLADASALWFAGPGLSAKLTGYHRPLSQKEANALREQLDQLKKKRDANLADPTAPAPTAEDRQAAVAARAKLAGRQRRQANPTLSESVTAEITVAADAAPGDYELRLRTPNGLSNPIVFQVGTLPEVVSPVVTAETPPAGDADRRGAAPRATPRQPPAAVTLPVLINGQILPGEVDRYVFQARAGQRLTVVVQARALLPYLADAVPGWFQATLAVTDSAGREVAYDDDFRFNPDPVLAYAIPADGDYAVEIKDSLFRGREDFVYRLALGELPFVTSIFPLGCPPSTKSGFALAGWNLPADRVEWDTTSRPPGGFDLLVRRDGHLSNRVAFVVGTQPETLEQEPNDAPDQAQALALPAVVNGRIGRPDDTDVYRLHGRAGDEVVAEIVARRLQSPLDSVLRLTDSAGHELAGNDDFDDLAAGLVAHQADSRLAATLPADGDYFLRVADAQHQGSPAHAYRLRVGPPHPDFELRVTPSAVNLRAGGSQVITVFALRHDGFAGEIQLALAEAPPGFSLSGARLPAGRDRIQLTVNAPAFPRAEPCRLRIDGVARVAGQQVTRPALPADDLMQAFLYRHLVPAREFLADVTGRTAPLIVTAGRPLAIPAGGTVGIQVATLYPRRVGLKRVELADAPAGITLRQTEARGSELELTIAADATQAAAGSAGNLILRGFAERTGQDGRKQPDLPLGPAPAIPYVIVAPPN